MTAGEFRIIDDGRGTYQFEGVLDIHQVERLRDFLESFSSGEHDLGISLAGLDFIDICALQVLIAFKHSRGVAARVRILDVSPEIEEVLAVCGLGTALLS